MIQKIGGDTWGGRVRKENFKYQRSLGTKMSLPEVGTPPPHDSGTPHGLVAGNATTTITTISIIKFLRQTIILFRKYLW